MHTLIHANIQTCNTEIAMITIKTIPRHVESEVAVGDWGVLGKHLLHIMDKLRENGYEISLHFSFSFSSIYISIHISISISIFTTFNISSSLYSSLISLNIYIYEYLQLFLLFIAIFEQPHEDHLRQDAPDNCSAQCVKNLKTEDEIYCSLSNTYIHTYIHTHTHIYAHIHTQTILDGQAFICFPHLSNIIVERIIRIGCAQKRLDKTKTRENILTKTTPHFRNKKIGE